MKKIGLLIVSVLFCLMCVGCKENEPVVKREPEIAQIRSICNLATLECYYHNVAKAEKEAGSGLLSIGEKDRKFWVEYTGIAKIGIDMSKVNMEINGENVKIYMPKAQLLSISVEEEELTEDSYYVSGDSWFNKNKITAEDQTRAIETAQKNMEESVKSNDALMLDAQNRAQELIENYIKVLGDISEVEYQIEWVYE